MLLVSACGKDIEIVAIASIETLSLEVFVLLFCLLLGFVNVSLSNKLSAAYKCFCFLKVIRNTVYYIRQQFYKKPITSVFIGFRSFLKVESMINALRWPLKIDCRCVEYMIWHMCSLCRLQYECTCALVPLDKLSGLLAEWDR